ncbi:MAG: DUF3373 family protein [Halioglobus sp.]|nr:DUF3373 family protein [Halioglobus sp.]
MKKSLMSLAVGATVAALTFSTAAGAATVEELSTQLEAMKAHMEKMQQELDALRAKEAQKSDTAIADMDDAELKEEVIVLREDVDELDERVMKPERHAAVDALEWGGDFRFQVHSLDSQIPDHFNGLQMQGDFIGLLQNFQLLGDNFTFDELSQAFATLQGFPPEQTGPIMQQIAQENFVRGYSFNDDLVRTSRLRLEMRADVAEDVMFYGRLAMYKVWGDSTGVQIFNGQPNSINWDGTQTTYPNSDDAIRVDRAYFTWNEILDTGAFLSIGRRPSTGGVPINFRNDEPRGGTPMGSLFNYQFDGITVGYHFNDYSVVRLCYGVGFESDWGNASQLTRPSDRLDDAYFYGLVWDIWDTPSMYIHAIVARAEDITDGFPATTVLPFDPITGEAIPADLPIRFTPSGTIGDMDLAGFVITRRDGPLDYFLSYGYMESDPTDYFSPFGGMFSDPFTTPESEDGDMIYVGARLNLNNDRTKIGLEYNHGSKYWFNFALGEDDFLSPKTSTRGDVWEAYLTHRIRDRFIFKLAYIDYQYDYSGSGWLLGAPKDLDDTPVLGYPTYDEAQMWTLGLEARF